METVVERQAVGLDPSATLGPLLANAVPLGGMDDKGHRLHALANNPNDQAVLCAAELAFEAGVPTKTRVRNILHCLIDGEGPAPA